jgi:hypothetical protein
MAEDEIIKKHTRAVYSTLMDKEKKWLHKLKDIFLEVLIIVFAVTVSIWFHNWSEERKDKKEEKEFYIGLKEDLKADTKEMLNDRAVFNQVLQHNIYLGKIKKTDKVNADSLMQFSSIFFTQGQINPRISRFEALKGSGKLDIIENKKQLLDIIELYQKIFPNIFRANQAFNSLNTSRITPYLGDIVQVDTTGFFTNFQAVLSTSKMRLMMMELQGDVANNIAAYTNGINKSNEIIKQIDADLEHW